MISPIFAFQCVVCQGHQGVIYCSVTYTSKLRQKETLQHARFKPPVYCVFYATESVFYTTRSALADGKTRRSSRQLCARIDCNIVGDTL